ncbi:hypothetical protein WJX79_007484 [Trebouxia sp. C0005]
MNDSSPRKRRRTMMRLYPDEEERDALEQEGYPPDGPGPEFMDMAMPDSEQYAPEEDDEDQIYMQQAATDTLLALQLLRSQFPAKAREVIVPFMLRSQLYSLVDDRTLVDRELDELRRDRVVRVLKLPTAPDDYAFMLSEDYATAVLQQQHLMQEAGTPVEQLQVFSWFRERVLARCPDNSITHHDVLRQLSADRKHKRRDEVTEQHISLLLNCGLLTRHLTQKDTYWFALAGIGPLIKSLVKGRKDLLGMLSRRRYPEMFVKELEQKKLSQSLLDSRFHIRDLIGLGSIAKVDTTSGPLLRIVKH